MFTNNIGSHEMCYACGKPEHQHGDPARQSGDNYCSCTKDEKISAAARGFIRNDIGFSEFKRIVRLNSEIEAIVAYSHGCPVHDFGWSSLDRECSCRFAYISPLDDYNRMAVNVVWTKKIGRTMDEAMRSYKNQ